MMGLSLLDNNVWKRETVFKEQDFECFFGIVGTDNKSGGHSKSTKKTEMRPRYEVIGCLFILPILGGWNISISTSIKAFVCHFRRSGKGNKSLLKQRPLKTTLQSVGRFAHHSKTCVVSYGMYGAISTT